MLKDQQRRMNPTYCFVTKVNDDNTINCKKIETDIELFDIRLVSANETNVMLMTPVVNSVVGVVFTADGEGFVTLYSEISEIQIGDGSNEGLVKAIELTNKLNTLEQDLNNLKSALSGWTPVPNDGGAALKTALTTYISETITETTKDEIQNETVTHGDL